MKRRQTNELPRPQKGAVLIVAILLLLIISMLSITDAGRALLEEKMASNQYVQTNSFLAAEAGLSKAREIAENAQIRQAVGSGDTDAIEKAWNQLAATYQNWHSVGDLASGPEFKLSPVDGQDAYWNAANHKFEVLSHGRAAAGTNSASQRTLGASIKFPPTTFTQGPSIFTSAVVGRRGISVGANSRIDSYNSDYGAYGSRVTVDGQSFTNSNSANSNDHFSGANTRTCEPGATVALNGNSPIYGDVISAGDLTNTMNASVYGDIKANGNANLSGNSHVYGGLIIGGNIDMGDTATVEGTIRSGGYFHSSGIARAKGDVTVSGNARFSSLSTAHATVTAGGNVIIDTIGTPPKAIRAGGKIHFPSGFSKSTTVNYRQGLSSSELGISPISPVGNTDVVCTSPKLRDPETDALGKPFTDVAQNPRTQFLGDWFDAHNCPYCYKRREGNLTLTGGQDNKDAAQTIIGTQGNETLLRVDGNVDTGERLTSLNIQGNVSLLVNGNFNISGVTSLNLDPDATLTLLVTGRTELGSGSNLIANGPFVRNGPDGQPRPAVMVYSAYRSSKSSDVGVTIGGVNDSHIAVYAPATRIKLTGIGSIYGSVVADKIDMSQIGQIHYDEALKRVSVSSTGSDQTNGRSPDRSVVVKWWEALDG